MDSRSTVGRADGGPRALLDVTSCPGMRRSTSGHSPSPAELTGLGSGMQGSKGETHLWKLPLAEAHLKSKQE